ncbi:YceI family protein [bacterium SCSIO 12741]|nr:YceI family protein [bacterium SCSIO 12741]
MAQIKTNTPAFLGLLIIILGLGTFGQVNAQGVWKTDSSHIKFFSEAPLENIEAENVKARGAINTEKNMIAISVPITGFKFEKELMEEHFNENYLESEKFPKGTFQGTFNEKIDWKKDGTYPATAKGSLTIHGVKRETTLKGTVNIKNGKIYVNAEFTVRLEDHDIEIPQIVFQNIAEEILVTCYFSFKQ